MINQAAEKTKQILNSDKITPSLHYTTLQHLYINKKLHALLIRVNSYKVDDIPIFANAISNSCQLLGPGRSPGPIILQTKIFYYMGCEKNIFCHKWTKQLRKCNMILYIKENEIALTWGENKTFFVTSGRNSTGNVI